MLPFVSVSSDIEETTKEVVYDESTRGGGGGGELNPLLDTAGATIFTFCAGGRRAALLPLGSRIFSEVSCGTTVICNARAVWRASNLRTRRGFASCSGTHEGRWAEG